MNSVSKLAVDAVTGAIIGETRKAEILEEIARVTVEALTLVKGHDYAAHHFTRLGRKTLERRGRR